MMRAISASETRTIPSCMRQHAPHIRHLNSFIFILASFLHYRIEKFAKGSHGIDALRLCFSSPICRPDIASELLKSPI